MKNIDVLKMDPLELVEWLDENYMTQVPEKIETIEELVNAGRLLSKLTNTYSYLMSLYSYAKIEARKLKQSKKEIEEINKSMVDDAIDRRDILKTFADTVKGQYSAVSRMITVKKQSDDDILMEKN